MTYSTVWAVGSLGCAGRESGERRSRRRISGGHFVCHASRNLCSVTPKGKPAVFFELHCEVDRRMTVRITNYSFVFVLISPTSLVYSPNSFNFTRVNEASKGVIRSNPNEHLVKNPLSLLEHATDEGIIPQGIAKPVLQKWPMTILSLKSLQK